MTAISPTADAASPAPPPPRAKDGHFPALDGIRGLAILLVILHHVNRMSPGGRIDNLFRSVADFGWVGVDLFFVLSGFLITGILFDAKSAHHYFRNFYARRVLRIFPLYYVFLFIFFILLPSVAPHLSAEFGKLPHPSLYLLYFANYSVVYFDRPMHGALSVAWSLAIEEQFYLVWPAVVFLCNRRTLMFLCGLIITAALICRTVMILHGDGWIPLYYLTQCRMDSLAFGALCALGIRGPGGADSFSKHVHWAAPLAAVAFIAVLLQQKTFHWVGGLGQTLGYTTIGLLSAALLLTALRARPDQPLHRFLASSPMRFFGRYSYAMYLFHLPVAEYVAAHLFSPRAHMNLGGSQIPGQIIFYLISGSITVAFALLSWNLLEKHMLRLKRLFPSADRIREPDK